MIKSIQEVKEDFSSAGISIAEWARDIRGPISCTIDFWCGLIHLSIMLLNKPLEVGLCNKAVDRSNFFVIVLFVKYS